MTRKEAVIAMLEGKKVSHKCNKHVYMYFDKNKGFRYMHGDGGDEPVHTALSSEDGYVLYNENTCDGKEIVIDGKKYKLTEVK